jgi:hypothetical protein
MTGASVAGTSTAGVCAEMVIGNSRLSVATDRYAFMEKDGLMNEGALHYREPAMVGGFG